MYNEIEDIMLFIINCVLFPLGAGNEKDNQLDE